MTGHEAGTHARPSPQPHAQGDSVGADDAAALMKALGEALEYRGDVTAELHDGSAVEGYIFDVRVGATPESSNLRIDPKDGSPRRSIAIDKIIRLVFSGKDAAAGKTWENWMRRYREKKLAGEAAGIDSESLDE